MSTPDDTAKVATRRYKHQTVYFLQAVTIGLVKIGISVDLEPRLRAIQAMCPDRLKLRGLFDCHEWGATERQLHREFKPYRAHGEWFNPAPELLDWILVNGDVYSRRVVLLQRVLDFPEWSNGVSLKRRQEGRLRARFVRGRIHVLPPV